MAKSKKISQHRAFSRKHLLVFVAIFSLIGGAILLNTYAEELTVTNRTWQCDGNVDYDLVKISVNTGSTRNDGAHLNCSGRIGRLEIDNWSGDGIKIHQEATNLVVESGYVRLHDCPNSTVHMDGIQAMGGNKVTFRNFLVDATDLGPQGCGANSALYINEGAGGNGKPTDVVFENSTFKKLEAFNRTVRIGSSIRSGIRNSTVYWCGDGPNCGAGNAIWFGDPTQQEDPINQNNTILLYSQGPNPPPPPPPPRPTVTLNANPTTINLGQSSTLSWTSTNATACTASGAWSGNKSTSGNQSVSPTTNSTYNLSCSGAGGTDNDSVAINVSTTPSTKVGDLNGDNKVDVLDLSILLSYFGTNNALVDINKDGIVNVFDFSILLSKFGT